MYKRSKIKLRNAPPRKEINSVKSDQQRSGQKIQQTLKQDSLAFALLGAAEVVAQVHAGTALPQALADIFSVNNPSPQARGAIQDIAYRTMRRLGLVQVLIGNMTSREPQPARLHGLLCCALMLLSESGEPDAENKGYESFTVVDQAVSATSADRAIAHGKGMINAILRRFLRERVALMQQAKEVPSAQWNYPEWWIATMQAAYPRDWQSILEAGNRAPPLVLRVNSRKTSVSAYLALLAANGLEGIQIGSVAVRLTKPLPVEQIPGFVEGEVSVQDAAAQLAALLLDVQDGMRVLDACAAPGGKTGHILESSQVDLVSLDVDRNRIQRIEENLHRLSVQSKLIVGDAARQTWWDGQLFDRILADVPCTASGIVRRHPDIRWLRRKSDAHRLATLSSKILDNLWQMLRPGGKLLFVTCSLWPQESEAQAAAFSLRHQAIRLAAPGQMLPTADLEQDHDGLFYALFQKQV